MSDLVRAFGLVSKALEELEIPFVIGGSFASNTHGVARSTQDIDLVVELTPTQLTSFAARLGKEFYLDAEAAREALLANRPFNAIHMLTAYKFDFFPTSFSPLGPNQINRRLFVVVPEISQFAVPVLSAEDVLLIKLWWFSIGGRISDRQWNDIESVAKLQVGRLDFAYLTSWASILEVDDLLAKLEISKPDLVAGRDIQEC